MTPSPDISARPGARLSGDPRRPVWRALSMALALWVVLGGLVWAPTVPAHAEGLGDDAVELTIESITPSGATDEGTVTIVGTARNTTSETIKGAQVYFWRSSDPITDPHTLDEVLASEPTNPVGARMYESPENYQALPQVPAGATPELEAGQTTPFTVRAELKGANSLGLHTPNAAYLVGLQVKVAGQQGVFGRARSLFSVAPKASVKASQVVLLNSRPSRVGGTNFADDHLADELRGRLAELLQLARTPGVTLVVDPALVDDVTIMSRGYTVKGTKGQGQARAKTWLAELTPLLTSASTYRTLYGSPDVAIARAIGRPELLARSATLPADHPLAGRQLAVVPTGGLIDDELASFLEEVKPSVVLASDLESSAPVQTARGLAVVRIDSESLQGGPGPVPDQTLAQRVGRLQATEVVRSREERPLVSLVRTADEARLARAAAPWRTLVPLPELVAAEERPEASFTASVAAADEPWSSLVDELGSDVQAWGELTGRADDARSARDSLLAQAISQAWPDSPSAGRWARQVRAEYGDLLAGKQISLNVTRQIVTTDPVQEMPVTVTNKLDQPVTVKVSFTSENPQRVDFDDSEAHTIPAGGTATIKVRINSRANGMVGATAQLRTTSGRPIGPVHPTEVTVTQMGRVGWIIIVGSGAVLLSLTAWRIRQVQHERRAAEAASVDARAAGGRLEPAKRTGN